MRDVETILPSRLLHYVLELLSLSAPWKRSVHFGYLPRSPGTSKAGSTFQFPVVLSESSRKVVGGTHVVDFSSCSEKYVHVPEGRTMAHESSYTVKFIDPNGSEVNPPSVSFIEYKEPPPSNDPNCPTCLGKGEILYFISRPGGPPGNQVLPCHTCRPMPTSVETCTWVNSSVGNTEAKPCGAPVGQGPYPLPRCEKHRDSRMLDTKSFATAEAFDRGRVAALKNVVHRIDRVASTLDPTYDPNLGTLEAIIRVFSEEVKTIEAQADRTRTNAEAYEQALKDKK